MKESHKWKTIALNKDDFQIENGIAFYMITYKGIPLWETISSSLEEYEFYLLDETMYPYGFLTLTCKDNLGNLFHYGRWEKLKQAQEWLDHPVRLY